jgi:hypothetical protein
LARFKGTKLEALFSGRWDQRLQNDSAGRIFLDVNPLCFQAIVDYLNDDITMSTVKIVENSGGFNYISYQLYVL